MRKSITIAAVQSAFREEDYRTPESYCAKVESIFRQIAQDPGPPPALVVFPELTGLWIPFITLHAQGRFDSPAAIALSLLARHPRRALSSLLAGRKLSFAFLVNWVETYHTWIIPFQEAATRYATYVCPGSCFLPEFDWEIAGGWHIRGHRVYNTSCIVNPRGRILGMTRKTNLTKDEIRLGIRTGPLGNLSVYDTGIGKVGILICLDGFYRECVNQVDRQGCELVLQPSANPRSWDDPPRRGAFVSQEQEWLSEGLGSLIQDTENIVASVNPTGVSSILGHRDEGKSNTFVNTARNVGLVAEQRLPGAYTGYPGLTAIAATCDQEEIVRLTIEWGPKEENHGIVQRDSTTGI